GCHSFRATGGWQRFGTAYLVVASSARRSCVFGNGITTESAMRSCRAGSGEHYRNPQQSRILQRRGDFVGVLPVFFAIESRAHAQESRVAGRGTEDGEHFFHTISVTELRAAIHSPPGIS